MPKTKKSRTGRVFECTENGDKKRESYSIFSKNEKYSMNRFDIACCAALAFHKSLIGIAELTLLEESSPSLRLSRAVQTYYCVYHLFVCAMLLDPEYVLVKKVPKGFDWVKSYEVDDKKLNSTSESPAQWNRGRNLEEDLAAVIHHADIRNYCKTIREQKARGKSSLEAYKEVLYKHYIQHEKEEAKCIPGLFEKLDYVRDRAVYRPTHVIYLNGDLAQTSRDVRKEIEGLPSAEDIYATVFEFYKAIKSSETLYFEFLLGIKPGLPITLDDDLVKRLGYSWEVLLKMGARKGKWDATVPNYLCQMMELFDEKDALRMYEKYWVPIMHFSGD